MTNYNGKNGTAYSWEWPALLGILLIVLGAIVIAVPIVATIALSLLIGAVFLVSGVAQLIHALRFSTSEGWVSRFLLATLSIIAGFVTLRSPIAGALGITLVLAFYLLLSGAMRGILAFDAKRMKGQGWLIISSLASFCLGFYLLFNLELNSLYIPGTLLGVDLIFYGVSLTFFAGNFRKGGVTYESEVYRRVA